MPNKVYIVPEAAITWLASGGSATFTLTSLGAGAGRQGALYDFGTSARSAEYTWRAWVKFATTPVVGEVVEMYWKTSDAASGSGGKPDNDDGDGDAAVSAEDKLRNLKFLGAITVDEASTTPVFAASGFLPPEWAAHRYGAPVFWNATADALSATAGDHGFALTPVPSEIQ